VTLLAAAPVAGGGNAGVAKGAFRKKFLPRKRR
jgi:hypothetical protein